jgi:hypothetical protein
MTDTGEQTMTRPAALQEDLDSVIEEREPTAAELIASRRGDVLLPEDEASPEEFPRLHNISAAFLVNAVIRPVEPAAPEYVTLPMPAARSLAMTGAIGQWNLLWEAAQFRRRFFDMNELPEPMATIADLGDLNVTFVPRTRSRYFEYAPLMHLLPKRTLDKFGLPTLRGGQWPFMADVSGIDGFLPVDFEQRLTRAWARTVWPHLVSGSPMKAFTRDDPIQLLAHDLGFWVPAVTSAIQERLRDFPEVDKGATLGPIPLVDGSYLPGAVGGHPRQGGHVWFGEDDARAALVETVEAADRTGRLRGILDAVRSNRAEDDFSPYWSNARVDFERKLHGTRRKVSVRFIEVPDTTPVQGPESEVLGNLVTNDFLTLLDVPNRKIVVLLNSGVTSRTEIASILGYANHSAVSKRLATIRQAAKTFFDAS